MVRTRSRRSDANRAEGRGRPVEGGILQGPQDPPRVQEELLPAGTAGGMVPALQPDVAVVPDRRPSAELAGPIHRGQSYRNRAGNLVKNGARPARPPRKARKRVYSEESSIQGTS